MRFKNPEISSGSSSAIGKGVSLLLFHQWKGV